MKQFKECKICVCKVCDYKGENGPCHCPIKNGEQMEKCDNYKKRVKCQ